MKSADFIKLVDYNKDAIKQPHHVNKHYMKCALEMEQFNVEELELLMFRNDYISMIEKYGYETIWELIE